MRLYGTAPTCQVVLGHNAGFLVLLFVAPPLVTAAAAAAAATQRVQKVIVL